MTWFAKVSGGGGDDSGGGCGRGSAFMRVAASVGKKSPGGADKSMGTQEDYRRGADHQASPSLQVLIETRWKGYIEG